MLCRGLGVITGLLFSANIFSKDVLLKWDPSPEPDVTGYQVYYGELGGAPDVRPVSTNEAGIPSLFGGITYFFYVTATNRAGLESDPSQTLLYTVPIESLDQSQLEIPVISSDGSATLRANGLAGATYVLQSTDDLNATIWTDLQAVIAGIDGSMEILDAAADSSKQRFYRLLEF